MPHRMLSPQANPSRNARRARHPGPGPRRRRLALAIAGLLAGPAGAAGQPGAPLTPSRFGPNLEAQLQASDDRVVGGLDLLAPLWQDPWNLAYGELKAYASDRQTQEVNLGLGFRRLTAEQGWILGAFAQYDRRSTGDGNDFDQATFGLEALGPRFDARLNYYDALSDAQRIDGWVGGIQYQGYRTFTQESFEEPLGGWDGELGVLLPIARLETRIYAGGYTLEGDLNDSDSGWKARLEVRPIKSLSLEVSYRDDDLFGSETAFTVRYAFGMPATHGIRTQRERMTETTRRDLDIQVAPPDVTPLRSVVLAENTVHIDSARGAPGGDGSYERPYGSVQECLGGRCAAGGGGAGALVRLWKGQSGEDRPYTAGGTWDLAPGQVLWGEGWRVEPARTSDPVYGNWLARGHLDPGAAPWLSPGAGAAGVRMAEGSALLGVAVDVRGAPAPTDLPGATRPAVIADGAAAFTVQGNLLLADAVGVEVRQVRAGLAAPPAPGVAPPVPGTDLEVAGGLSPTGPLGGRILDNLILLPPGLDPATAAPGTGALSLVNLAQDGAASHQAIVYRPGDPALAPAGLGSAPSGLLLDNRAVGAGSRATQQVLVLDTDLSVADIGLTNAATGGAVALQDLRLIGASLAGTGARIRADNRAADGAQATQTLVLEVPDSAGFGAALAARNAAEGGAAATQGMRIAGPLTLTGVDLENRAQTGGTATQGAWLAGVAIADPSGAGILVRNRAEGAGSARQGIAIRAAGLDLPAGGIDAGNAAVGPGGMAVQQIEIASAGGAGMARLDLGNEARDAGVATQEADIAGIDLISPAGGQSWLGVGNGGFAAGQATQRVRLADLDLHLPQGGIFVGNGAYSQASAYQEVAVVGDGAGTIAWLSAFDQAAAGASADQRIAVSGVAVAQAADGSGGIEAVNGAYGGAAVNQSLALELTGAQLPDATLDTRNRAETGSAAAQGLTLRVAGATALKSADLDNDAVSGSRTLQEIGLALAGPVQMRTLDAGNRVASAGVGHQSLAVSGAADPGAAGSIGDLRLANLATGQSTGVQRMEGAALPLLNAQGLAQAVNESGESSAAYQSVGLSTGASDGPGAKPFALDNQAGTDSVAVQGVALQGTQDPGLLGALTLDNRTAAGGRAVQRADFAGVGLSAPYLDNRWGDLLFTAAGVQAENAGDGGLAAQGLTLDTANLTSEAGRLAAFNRSDNGGQGLQTLDLRGTGGRIAGLAVANGADRAGQSGQVLALAGPVLDLAGTGSLSNSAQGGGTAGQILHLRPAALTLGDLGALAVDNGAGAGAQAAQTLDLDIAGTFAQSQPAGWGSANRALALANGASEGGRAVQETRVWAAGIDLRGRALAASNQATTGALAGQWLALDAAAGAGLAGQLRTVNDADQGTALQGVAVAGIDASAGIAAENRAQAQARAVQSLDFSHGRVGGTVTASDRAGSGSAAQQSLGIAALPGAELFALTLGADGAGGGRADQSAVLSGLRSVATGPAAAATASAAGGSVNQVLDLAELALIGGERGLDLIATATEQGAVVQQATLRRSAVQGGELGILADPGAPAAGTVEQHLILWETPATVRFEPTVVYSLDELAGIRQTFTVDGVRQTIWRRLVLPGGDSSWIDGDGNPGSGSSGLNIDSGGGAGAGGISIGTGPGGIVIGIIGRKPNLGDALSPEAGAQVAALGLPASAELPPGALRYMADLLSRRGTAPAGPVPIPLGGGIVLTAPGQLQLGGGSATPVFEYLPLGMAPEYLAVAGGTVVPAPGDLPPGGDGGSAPE